MKNKQTDKNQATLASIKNITTKISNAVNKINININAMTKNMTTNILKTTNNAISSTVGNTKNKVINNIDASKETINKTNISSDTKSVNKKLTKDVSDAVKKAKPKEKEESFFGWLWGKVKSTTSKALGYTSKFLSKHMGLITSVLSVIPLLSSISESLKTTAILTGIANLSLTLGKVMNLISTTFGVFKGKDIKGSLKSMGSNIITNLEDKLTNAISNILGKSLKSVGTSIKGLLNIGKVIGNLKDVTKTITSAIANFNKVAGEAVIANLNSVISNVNKATTNFSKNIKGVTDSVKGITGSIKGVTDSVKGATKSINSAIKSIKGAVSSIKKFGKSIGDNGNAISKISNGIQRILSIIDPSNKSKKTSSKVKGSSSTHHLTADDSKNSSSTPYSVSSQKPSNSPKSELKELLVTLLKLTTDNSTTLEQLLSSQSSSSIETLPKNITYSDSTDPYLQYISPLDMA